MNSGFSQSSPRSPSSRVEASPLSGVTDEVGRAVGELRHSTISMEDVEQIEDLVDALMEHPRDTEALIDMLAGISLNATTVAAMVKEYANLRRVLESRA